MPLLIRTTVLAIGRHRDAPRIYLEGRYLLAAGFTPGSCYAITYENHVIRLETSNDGRTVTGKRRDAIGVREQLYHRVMDSPWNADDDPEPTPLEAVDWDMLTDSIGDILHRLGDWADLSPPEIVERFVNSWPPHYRDAGLPQVRQAPGQPGLPLRLAQRWQQQADQQRHDAEDHQEFDQRECSAHGPHRQTNGPTR
jgi:hypothetical protein